MYHWTIPACFTSLYYTIPLDHPCMFHLTVLYNPTGPPLHVSPHWIIQSHRSTPGCCHLTTFYNTTGPPLDVVTSPHSTIPLVHPWMLSPHHILQYHWTTPGCCHLTTFYNTTGPPLNVVTSSHSTMSQVHPWMLSPNHILQYHMFLQHSTKPQTSCTRSHNYPMKNLPVGSHVTQTCEVCQTCLPYLRLLVTLDYLHVALCQACDDLLLLLIVSCHYFTLPS